MYTYTKDKKKILEVTDEGGTIVIGVDKDGNPITEERPMLIKQAEYPTIEYLDNLVYDISDLDRQIAILIVRRNALIIIQKALKADIPELPIEPATPVEVVDKAEVAVPVVPVEVIP
jgi:hypothetical protein